MPALSSNREVRGAPGAVRRFRAAEPGGSTVFVVHPGAMPPTVHRVLAAALPDGHGLTVLDLSALPEYQSPARTDRWADTTVERLAERLLALLDEEQPECPPVLAGWSFGGVVAHTMVHAMAPHRRPGRLVLLDSIAPTESHQRSDDELETRLLLGWFAMYLGAKRGRAVDVRDGRIAGDDGLAVVLETAIAAGALTADVSLPGLRKLYETYVDGLLRNNHLTAGHRPPPARIPLVLVKAERSLIPGERDLGWHALAGHGLTVHPCPGDHYTMLTRPDAAAAIARALF